MRGYTKDLATLLKKRAKFSARCQSCRYFGDDGCENNSVTKFDVVNDDGRVFCVFWLPPQEE